MLPGREYHGARQITSIKLSVSQLGSPANKWFNKKSKHNTLDTNYVFVSLVP